MKQEKDVRKAKFKKKQTTIFLPTLLTVLQIKNNFPCFWRLGEIAQEVVNWIEFLGQGLGGAT